jgi:hypothetical protein
MPGYSLKELFCKTSYMGYDNRREEEVTGRGDGR